LKLVHHFTVAHGGVAVDLISHATPLSKTAIKDCLNKGGIWLHRSARKEQRIRKAKLVLQPGDKVSIYYDDAILNLPVPAASCLYTCNNYSIWYKPAGLLSQGTRYGDHCSLMRYARKVGRIKTPYLVHRLDREAKGLVLLAHTSSAAAKFSELFRNGCIEKRYHAIVAGILGRVNETFQLNEPLDNKPAATSVMVTSHDLLLQRSTLDIILHTGRYHQIRRHLSMLGFPLVGDWKYGGERDQNGLLLTAYSLSFICPFLQKRKRFRVD